MNSETIHPFDDDSRPFRVLVNAEAQYSLWPEPLPLPAGWRLVHGPASRADCVAHIEQHWHDMRPLSLQQLQP